MVLGHSAFIIQFSKFFSQKDLKLIPYSYTWKETFTLKCLVNSKAATVTETPVVYTSHLGQKEGKYMIKKAPCFFRIFFFFFGYASGAFLGF